MKEARRTHGELSRIDTIVSHVKRDWNEFVAYNRKAVIGSIFLLSFTASIEKEGSDGE
jgi:hypothetical protein